MHIDPAEQPEHADGTGDRGEPRGAHRTGLWLIGLCALVAACAILRLLTGSQGFGWPTDDLVRTLRLSSALTAACVGAALGLAGLLLQTLVRNPLASPDLLGLSAGASLAVVLATAWGGSLGFETAGLRADAWRTGPALLGASAALSLVYSLSRRNGSLGTASLVLVGVMISVMCGSAIMLVWHLWPAATFEGMARVLVGSIEDRPSLTAPLAASAVCGAGIVLAAWKGPSLDALCLSSDEARSVGVHVGRMRLAVFLVSGLLTGVAVVLAGPVGFVGLVAPHAARALVGSTHRVSAPAAAACGAALLLAADAVGRSITFPSGRIPVGVVTALMGGPVMIALIRRTQARSIED